jgi:hypothetical protein
MQFSPLQVLFSQGPAMVVDLYSISAGKAIRAGSVFWH